MNKEKTCKVCGRKTSLSQHGLCYDCSIKRVIENIKQLKEKYGPYYERWAKGYKKFANSLPLGVPLTSVESGKFGRKRRKA